MGFFWYGARKFEGKNVSIVLVLAGVPLWLAACSIGPILCSAGGQSYGNGGDWHRLYLLAVRELWLGRGDGVWRWPIMGLLLGHAASIPIDIPIAGAWKHPDPADVDLLTFMIFEAAFVSICGAYLFGGLVKDRIAAGYGMPR